MSNENKRFQKIAFTVYPVKDMKIARHFYENTLGFTPGENFEGQWQEYEIGGNTFAISNMITEFLKPGTQGSVSLEVCDLNSLCSELKSKNVPFKMSEIMDTPVCRMQFILDPDGNTIGLHQCK